MLETIKKFIPNRYLLKFRFYFSKSLKDLYSDLKNRKKELSKNKRYYNLSSNKKFINDIKNKKIVSFDIFDTILIRPFENPKDLFKFIEEKYNTKGFYYRRIEAEERARFNCEYEEITYDDIYNEILPEFQFLKQMELEWEFNLLRVNPLIKEKYELVLSMGKDVILTSDMYLDKKFIESVLKKNGISNYKKLYISSEIKKTKRTASIFQYILNDLNINAKDIVHFGDNEKSDFINPKSLKIDSFLVPKLLEHPQIKKRFKWVNEFYKKHPALNGSIFKSIIYFNFWQNDSTDYLYKLGYLLGGPLVLSYLNFILENCVAHKIDKLFFVARDGWILKEIYRDNLYSKFKIDFSYVYLSRMVGLFGTLEFCDDAEYLKKILRDYKSKGNDIEIFDSYEKNKQEYYHILQNMKETYKDKIDSLRKHIEKEAGNSSKIAVIDMTTDKFASMYFASNILKERVKLGFYSFVWNGSRKYKYLRFGVKKNTGDDYKYIKLSELLVSSPENNIISFTTEGPVYKKDEDKSHRQIYEKIAAGIKKYTEDVFNLFGDNYYMTCLDSFDEWIELARMYMTFLPKEDFKSMKEIEHTDLFSRKSKESVYEIFK